MTCRALQNAITFWVFFFITKKVQLCAENRAFFWLVNQEIHVCDSTRATREIRFSDDAYNYHLSQLRIRIEMCFGRLVSKWRIFKSPLCVNVNNATRIINKRITSCILYPNIIPSVQGDYEKDSHR